MSVQLSAFGQTQKVFHGSKKCPRTVVIQMLTVPVFGANVFISTDKAALDQAQSSINGTLTEGIGVVDQSGTQDRLVLQNVVSDIFARANDFGTTDVIILGVESF